MQERLPAILQLAQDRALRALDGAALEQMPRRRIRRLERDLGDLWIGRALVKHRDIVTIERELGRLHALLVRAAGTPVADEWQRLGGGNGRERDAIRSRGPTQEYDDCKGQFHAKQTPRSLRLIATNVGAE